MKTAALLPTMDDGFCISFWMDNYRRVWADEVDELIVLTSGPSAPSVTIEGPHVRVIRCGPGWVQHGDALRRLIESTDADAVMLCEEDAYIRRPGVVAEHFAMLADHDVVASPRDGGSSPLLARAHKRWGDCRSGDEQGTGFWPAFAFIRRDMLLRTDMEFDPRRWRKGQNIPGLRMRAPDVDNSDETLMCASWQMRDMGARIRLVDQYRVTDTWLMRRWLAQDPPWMHVGSLSSGAGIYNGDLRIDPAHAATLPWDFARRISWWRRFADAADQSDPRLPMYRTLLDRLVVEAPIDQQYIEGWTRVYDQWVTWR